MKRGSVSCTTSPDNQVFRRRLTDWNIWRSPSKSERKNSEVDQDRNFPHLSEDFIKKLDEWRMIKCRKSSEEQTSSERRDSIDYFSIQKTSDLKNVDSVRRRDQPKSPNT